MPRRNWTKSQKARIAKEWLDAPHGTKSFIAEKYGLNPIVVYRWIKQLEEYSATTRCSNDSDL